MGKISKCTACNGTGWKGKIPCVTCYTRGIVSDELYDKVLIRSPSMPRNC